MDGQRDPRIDELEARVEALERYLLSTGARRVRAVPSPSPAAALDKAVADARATARTAPGGPAAVGPSIPAGPGRLPSTAVARVPRPPSSTISFAELEERLSGRLLAWVGGVALIIGAVFFLSLAFSRGWIGPEARVLIGLVAGAAGLAVGGWSFERGHGAPALVLIAVGIGTGTLALFAAAQLYDFIPAQLALIGSLALAVGAAVIALRTNSQVVAALGLLAIMTAPPVMGAPSDLGTVVFLGSALVGTTVIAVTRSWRWIPALAFAVTAPQASRWLAGEPNVGLALAAIAAYWMLNGVAAGGESIWRDGRTLHWSAATLLIISGLFAIFEIRVVMGGESAALRTAAFVALAAGHAALAAPLLVRTKGRHPFGLLAASASVGVLAITIGLELGGIYQPIAWTALAAGVAAVAIAYRQPAATALALVVGSLAVGHLVSVEYPLDDLRLLTPTGWPFASPEGIVATLMAAASLVLGALAGAVLPRRSTTGRRDTSELGLVAGVLGAAAVVAYAAPFELEPYAAVVCWSALALAVLGAGYAWRTDALAWLAGQAGALVLVAMGIVEAVSKVAPLDRLTVDLALGTGPIPVFNEATVALLAPVVALVAGSRLAGRRDWVADILAVAAALVVYAVSIAVVDVFQARIDPLGPDAEIATQAQVALSICWIVIGAGAFAAGLLRRSAVVRLFGLGLLAIASAKVFLVDLAALDVAYRVLSFIGLGLVLLASSFLATRLRSGQGPSAPAGT